MDDQEKRDKLVDKVDEKKSESSYDEKKLLNQVINEVKLAYDFIQPKMAEWYVRLKLYNNQRRDKEAVGDPLMFTIHQTITASLYDDELSVQFSGREDDGGDDERADVLQDVAEFDYDEMEKNIVDYDWIWDAGFFGRGIVLFTAFDRESLTPAIECVDITTFLRDPRAKSVNGNKYGQNGCRFLGRYIRRTKKEMEDLGGFEHLDELKNLPSVDKDSLIEKAREARANAQNRGNSSALNQLDLGENTEYELIQWFTWYDKKRVCVEISSDKNKVMRFLVLKNQNKWPMVDRPLYPTAHDWDGVSIPDMTEDKQRARAKLINLGLATATAELYPMYVYNRDKIRNRADLNFEFNKFVGVDGDVNNTITPIQKASFSNAVSFILESLDNSAQKSTATPDIQQGMTSKQDRTLGELNIVANKVDTRYSLSAKVFGWSEKAFWEMWYQMYADYMTDADKKFIRIKGYDGKKLPKTISKADMIYQNSNPDIFIESKVISEGRRMRLLQSFTNYATLLMADPNANRRYALRKLGKLNGLDVNEVERIYPPTPDEILAEYENEKLSANEMVVPTTYEDPMIHLDIHDKAFDTPAKKAHLEATRELIRIRMMKPELFPQQQAAPAQVGTPTANTSQPTGAIPAGGQMMTVGGGQ